MRLLDWLFPPFCAACDRIGHYLCLRHLNDLCWNYQPPIENWIWSAFEYRDSAQSLVIQVKYHFYYRYAEVMSQLISLRYPHFRRKAIDVLIPVPLHRRRRRWRGFNQAETLAKHLSRHWQIPIETQSLIRTKHSKTQASLNRENRQKIDQQFLAVRSLSGRKVLLIDDVVTTGSTLAACRQALHAAGAVEVLALTFAREI